MLLLILVGLSFRPAGLLSTRRCRVLEAENACTNWRDAAAVVAEYAAWLPAQPLSARTRETYLAAVRTFVAWLGERDGGCRRGVELTARPRPGCP
jgi:hypothetical protein